MIQVTHLQKQYSNGLQVLRDVNTTIKRGEVISIIGPSGTGKSTFLRCLNMLETPTGGQILVNGEDITSPKTDITKIRQKMGMVFQSFNLLSIYPSSTISVWLLYDCWVGVRKRPRNAV